VPPLFWFGKFFLFLPFGDRCFLLQKESMTVYPTGNISPQTGSIPILCLKTQNPLLKTVFGPYLFAFRNPYAMPILITILI
jgi:hypothetical protein